MTFQTHKLIKIDGREDFWMPHGPAFFTKAEADQFHADNFTGEQFKSLRLRPLVADPPAPPGLVGQHRLI